MSCWRPCAGARSRSAAAPLALALALALAAGGGAAGRPPATGETPAAGATPAAGHQLHGEVVLTGPGARAAEPAQAVVWWQPSAGARPVAGRFEMVTRNKRFEPRVLAVGRGSTVRFPNADPILHNVFSVTRGNAFDLGLLRRGEGGVVRLDDPGVVRVFCNVHHSMVGYLVVLDTPHFAVPGAGGGFALAGLPAGPGTLTAWHEQGDPVTVELRLPAARPVTLELAVTRPRVPPHLDKRGRSYGLGGRDRYRR